MSNKLFGTFLGLDFREDSLILSYIHNSISGITLLSSSEFPLRGTDEDINEIREYIRRHGKGVSDIFVCVPDRWAMTKFIHVPSAKGKDTIDQLMSFEIERHIPFNIEDVVYDFQIIEERDKLLIVVFTALRKQKLEKMQSVLDQLALQPKVMTTSSFSVLSAIEMSGISVGGWQQVIGVSKKSHAFGKRGEVNIILFAEKGRMEMAITQDGICNSIRTFVIDETNFDTTIDDVIQHSGEMKSSLRFETFKKCVIAGDISILKPYAEKLNDRLDIEIEKIDPLAYFSTADQDVNLSGLTQSIGACYIGLGMGSFRINLLPHKREHRIQSKASIITQILVGIIVILLIAMVGMEYSRKKRFLNNVEKTLKENEAEVVKIEKLSETIALFEKRRSQLQQLRDREITLDILAELSLILPKDAWITNLHYKGLSTASKKDEDAELVLSGFAESSSILIPLLEDSPLFDKVEFVGPIKKSRNKEGFKLRARVIDPLIDVSGKQQEESKGKK